MEDLTALPNDTQLLDALEALLDQDGALLLWNKDIIMNEPRAKLAAPGLAFGKKFRSLREALSQLVKKPVFTVESMIQTFGDQAYHKGCAIAVEALRIGDRATCVQMAKVNFELMRLGYHRKADTTTPKRGKLPS